MDDMYDFNGISLDFSRLRIDNDTTFLAESEGDEDEDEDWYPPTPPPYDVADKLAEVNERFFSDPTSTIRIANRLRWRTDLVQIKWLHANSSSDSSESETNSSSSSSSFSSPSPSPPPPLSISLPAVTKTTFEPSISERIESYSTKFMRTLTPIEDSDEIIDEEDIESVNERDQVSSIEEVAEFIDVVRTDKSDSLLNDKVSTKPMIRKGSRNSLSSNSSSSSSSSLSTLNGITSSSSSSSMSNRSGEGSKAYAQWKHRKRQERLLSERRKFLMSQKRRICFE